MIIWFFAQTGFLISELFFAILYGYMILKIKQAEKISGIAVPAIGNIIAIFNCIFIFAIGIFFFLFKPY